MPRELSYLGAEALVDLIDSRQEDWKEPPKVLQPFSGGGYRLGSSSAPMYLLYSFILTFNSALLMLHLPLQQLLFLKKPSK